MTALDTASYAGPYLGGGARQDLPVEFRFSNVAGVNFAQRIVEVIAVPYEEDAAVEYRGEMWRELFLRGSFDGIEKQPNRVRANRDPDRSRTVGKVVRFSPSRSEGLLAAVRIAQTVWVMRLWCSLMRIAWVRLWRLR